METEIILSDDKKLMNLNEKLFNFEATVVTGCEKIAAGECKEKLSIENVTTDQGRIFFATADDQKDVLALRCVDNVNVIIYKGELNEWPKEKIELRNVFMKLLEQSEWRKGLIVWQKVFDTELKFNLNSITIDNEASGDLERPKFRVSCNRVGDKHSFTSMEAASEFGAVINDTFHWPVSMKEFDIEVNLNIREKEIIVSLALTKQSLHFRNLISLGPTSLRSTICHNMLRLAEIKTGEIVLDPLSGSGAIPVECSIGWPLAYTIASDNHERAIENTLINVKQSSIGPVEIINTDSTKLPIKNEFLDVLITDLPFGKRMGSKRNNRTLYPMLFKEFARCSRPETGRAILLTQDKKGFEYALNSSNIRKYWFRYRAVYVKVGGLAAAIFCLKRSAEKFTE